MTRLSPLSALNFCMSIVVACILYLLLSSAPASAAVSVISQIGYDQDTSSYTDYTSYSSALDSFYTSDTSQPGIVRYGRDGAVLSSFTTAPSPGFGDSVVGVAASGPNVAVSLRYLDFSFNACYRHQLYNSAGTLLSSVDDCLVPSEPEDAALSNRIAASDSLIATKSRTGNNVQLYDSSLTPQVTCSLAERPITLAVNQANDHILAVLSTSIVELDASCSVVNTLPYAPSSSTVSLVADDSSVWVYDAGTSSIAYFVSGVAQQPINRSGLFNGQTPRTTITTVDGRLATQKAILGEVAVASIIDSVQPNNADLRQATQWDLAFTFSGYDPAPGRSTCEVSIRKVGETSRGVLPCPNDDDAAAIASMNNGSVSLSRVLTKSTLQALGTLPSWWVGGDTLPQGNYTISFDLCTIDRQTEVEECVQTPYNFYVAYPDPEIWFEQTPPAVTSLNEAEFYTEIGPGSQYRYWSLDGGPYIFSGSPYRSYSGLDDGVHELCVQTTWREDINVRDTECYTWLISQAPPLDPPTVDITSGPNNPTNVQSGQISYTEGGGAIDIRSCELNSTPVACGSPVSVTAQPGPNNFSIEVSNASGSASDSYSWNYRPTPTVDITSQPPASSTNTSGGFGWTKGNVSSITDETCSLNGVQSPCSDSYSFSNLSVGTHSFTIVVSDAQVPGSQDSETVVFEVVAPAITLTETPDAVSNSTSAHFEWTSSFSPGFGWLCQLNSEPAAPCSMPPGQDYAGLTRGSSHTFQVSGFDLGSLSTVTADYAWDIRPQPVIPPPLPPKTCEQDGVISSLEARTVSPGDEIVVGLPANVRASTIKEVQLNGKALEQVSYISGTSGEDTYFSYVLRVPGDAKSGFVRLVCESGVVKDPGEWLTVVEPKNLAPKANAIARATSKHSKTFVVDGSLSEDPDGRIVKYAWTYKGKVVSRKAKFRYGLPTYSSRKLGLKVWDNQGATDSTNLVLKPNRPAPQTLTFRSNFNFDSYKLTKRGKSQLAKARKYIKGAKVVTISTGASYEGSKAYNRRLTANRAKTAKAFLLKNMSKKSRPKVKLAPRGETSPVASNKTPGGRYKNRYLKLRITF